jgi:hypothetical protein
VSGTNTLPIVLSAILAHAAWGSVPDWFAAVGTVGALVATARLLAIEAGRRHDERSHGEAAQASLVTWWMGTHVEGSTFEVHIRNSGDAPAYGALLVRRKTNNLVLHTLPPGETLNIRYDFEVANPGLASYEYEHMYLHFMDTHHRAWRRGAWGILERLPSADPLPEDLPA